jgi:hypothetical protein
MMASLRAPRALSQSSTKRRTGSLARAALARLAQERGRRETRYMTCCVASSAGSDRPARRHGFQGACTSIRQTNRAEAVGQGQRSGELQAGFTPSLLQFSVPRRAYGFRVVATLRLVRDYARAMYSQPCHASTIRTCIAHAPAGPGGPCPPVAHLFAALCAARHANGSVPQLSGLRAHWERRRSIVRAAFTRSGGTSIEGVANVSRSVLRNASSACRAAARRYAFLVEVQ